MKYQGIKKIYEGKYITRYDVDYITAEGHAKTYEMISRNKISKPFLICKTAKQTPS